MAVNLEGRQDGSGAGFMDKFFEEVNIFFIGNRNNKCILPKLKLIIIKLKNLLAQLY